MSRHRPVVWLPVLALLSLAGPVTLDIIFHVPEVLVRHAAVPRPVGTGRSNNSRTANESEPWTSEDGLVQERYEYYVEHEVTTDDAKKAAAALKIVEPRSSPAPGCGVCSKRDLEYCETKIMADHCCCERRFIPEPFPWLPHTCYLGPERCHTLAHNCEHYTRIRDCCCNTRLAMRWKGILSRSSHVGAGSISLVLVSLVLFAAYV